MTIDMTDWHSATCHMWLYHCWLLIPDTLWYTSHTEGGTVSSSRRWHPLSICSDLCVPVGYHVGKAHGLIYILQAQLVPQLIINYKLKVRRRTFFLTWDWVMTGLTECGAHAYESNDIQIALYRGRWSFRVRAFHLFLWVAIMVCSFCIKMPFLHRLACFRWVWLLIDR